MTLKELASELAKREGKKSEASIGDVRELLKHLVVLVKEDLLITEEGVKSPILSTLFDEATKTKKKTKKKSA